VTIVTSVIVTNGWVKARWQSCPGFRSGWACRSPGDRGEPFDKLRANGISGKTWQVLRQAQDDRNWL